MSNIKTNFIEFMLKAGVLKFGSFITKSGRATPYFVNTGNYTKGSELSYLGKAYAKNIIEKCGNNFDALFGPAYKGITLVTAVSIAMAENLNIDKPVFFNRKEAKDHGEGGVLVGYNPKPNDRIILIDDVITAGTAIGESMDILAKLDNLQIKDMFISVNRCEVGKNSNKTAVMEVEERYGIRVHSIIDITDIKAYLEKEQKMNPTKERQSYIFQMEEYMDKEDELRKGPQQ